MSLPPGVPAERGDELQLAASEGRLEDLTKYLEELDIAETAPNGLYESATRTALFEAASAGHVDCVRLLLRQGVLPNQANADGVTPLHTAAADGHAEVVAALIETGLVDVNCSISGDDSSQQTALGLAASEDYVQVVKVLLASGRDIDVNKADEGGASPLFSAAEIGATDSVACLLQHPDISVDAQNTEGRTALWIACGMGNLEVVEALLSRVDVNLADSAGTTPLHCAAESGHAHIVSALLHSDHVNPNIASRDGQTPLGIAAAKGRVGAIRRLLDCNNVDPNAPSEGGGTPLCVAALAGQVESVQELLSCERVDPNATDTAGHTPLQVIRDALDRDLGERMDLKVKGKWEEIEQILANA